MVDDSELDTNPYKPSSSVVDAAEYGTPDRKLFRWKRSLGVWALVCSVNAIPSFVFGMAVVGAAGVPWMLAGIAIFIVGYVGLDWMTYPWWVRQRTDVRRALIAMYGTRFAITILFPVGGYCDFVCGIVTHQALRMLTGLDPEIVSQSSGWMVLVWTLLQGLVMNGLIAMAGVVWWLFFAFLQLFKATN